MADTQSKVKPSQLTNVLSKRCYNRWKASAKKRGIPWELTIEYLQQLFFDQNEQCPVTHEKLTFVRDQSKYAILQTASLDRIENDKGYIKGNVRFTTKYFNMLKHVMSDAQLIEYCRRIVIVNDYKKIVCSIQ